MGSGHGSRSVLMHPPATRERVQYQGATPTEPLPGHWDAKTLWKMHGWATITAAALIPCMSHAFDGTLFGILPSGYRSSARATAPGLRRTRMASRESTGDEPFRSMDGQSDLRGGRDRTRNQQVTRHPNSYHFVVACTVAALAQTIFGSVHSRRCLL